MVYQRHRRRGFTLVELLVVIAIIMLAAGLFLYAVWKLYGVVKQMFFTSNDQRPAVLVLNNPEARFTRRDFRSVPPTLA